MRLGAWLFLGLVLASFYNVWMQARGQRRARRMEQALIEVHAVLVIWAETWPDPAVRARLLAALKQ